MNAEQQIAMLLAAHNFVLDRSHKHRVYRDPAGQIFVMARTPSDRRAFDNALGNLRRLLGIRPEVSRSQDRRRTNRRQKFNLISMNVVGQAEVRPSLADQLARVWGTR
jgi:hypothetical protein